MQRMPRVVARFQAAGGAGDRTRISGHGVTWGLLNDYNRVFVHGAFADSLGEIDDRHPLPIGWMHEIPMGVWDDVHEDTTGLFLDGLLSQTSTGNDAGVLMRDGLNALSIGFWPLVIQYAEPGERVSFDTPYGTRAYQFDDYAMYIIRAELVECSFVFVGADDEARVESVQALVREARQHLPGLAHESSWEDTAASMARLLAGDDKLPELERHALYGALVQSYGRHEKTPPPFAAAGANLAAIAFQHGERALYAEHTLREQLTAVAQTAPLLDRVDQTTRDQARQTLSELQQLLDRKDEQQLLAELEASLRETTQNLKEPTH